MELVHEINTFADLVLALLQMIGAFIVVLVPLFSALYLLCVTIPEMIRWGTLKAGSRVCKGGRGSVRSLQGSSPVLRFPRRK